MIHLQTLFFFDAASIITMIIVANLSKRLGSALQIKPYYKLLYGTSLAVLCSSGLDILMNSLQFNAISAATMSLRCIAGAVALITSLRYWNWLFAEFLKK